MPESVSRSRSWRPLAWAAVAWLGCTAAPGCGPPATRQGPAMPPPEWIAKFQKEHPEAFKSKDGKGKHDVDIRERRAILRREWAKAQAQGQQ
jgi:hypothetical protein